MSYRDAAIGVTQQKTAILKKIHLALLQDDTAIQALPHRFPRTCASLRLRRYHQTKSHTDLDDFLLFVSQYPAALEGSVLVNAKKTLKPLRALYAKYEALQPEDMIHQLQSGVGRSIGPTPWKKEMQEHYRAILALHRKWAAFLARMDAVLQK